MHGIIGNEFGLSFDNEDRMSMRCRLMTTKRREALTLTNVIMCKKTCMLFSGTGRVDRQPTASPIKTAHLKFVDRQCVTVTLK